MDASRLADDGGQELGKWILAEPPASKVPGRESRISPIEPEGSEMSCTRTSDLPRFRAPAMALARWVATGESRQEQSLPGVKEGGVSPQGGSGPSTCTIGNGSCGAVVRRRRFCNGGGSGILRR